MNFSVLPTVIIPIHNAAKELENCLESVHRNSPAGLEVLLIDDASDDPLVQPLLRHWIGRAGPGARLELLSRNLGFVGAVNHGMDMTRGDVVLLNSDTLVTPGWLEGLHRCLGSDQSIATATPWTNNGEICSIPEFVTANEVPDDPDRVAEIIAATGRAEYLEIPTAVGFCMAISRVAIEQVGKFDQELFGLGYGEENDFSMRVRNINMKNVLCDDVYVAHVGGRSFGPKGLAPDQSSMDRLLSRHPRYLELIQAFITEDPLLRRRTQLVDALRDEGLTGLHLN